jgi:hypothetical protein
MGLASFHEGKQFLSGVIVQSPNQEWCDAQKWFDFCNAA